MPGLLKNSVDWASRFHPQPFNERYGLLLSASPSMVGGNRGLWALRVPFEHLGARVYPDMFSLAQAHKAFDDDGRIADHQLQARFETNIVNFMVRSRPTSIIRASSRRGWSTSGSIQSPLLTGSSSAPIDRTACVRRCREVGSLEIFGSPTIVSGNNESQ
jgi:hypothetical protein